MCNITTIKTNRRIGYKILAWDGHKFYSSFTGQEFTEGQVPEPPTYCRPKSSFWNTRLWDVALIEFGWYNKHYVGKTAAFLTIEDAKLFLKQMIFSPKAMSLKIVEIKFNGTVFKGEYYFNGYERDVICGDNIDSIKITKDGNSFD